MTNKGKKGGTEAKASSTTVSVDSEEMQRADSILESMGDKKNLRILRVNRSTILRIAIFEGLDVLERKLQDGEPII